MNSAAILDFITPHQMGDILYYAAFLGGQALFILKRASSAIRSKTNPISSRRAYLKANWDVLLVRLAIEFPIFYGYRHYDVNTILSFFTSWKVPFAVPQGATTSFMLGFLADSVLDWIGTSPKVPDWLRENIPSVQVYSSHTVQAGIDSTGAPITVEKTVTVEKVNPDQEKSV